MVEMSVCRSVSGRRRSRIHISRRIAYKLVEIGRFTHRLTIAALAVAAAAAVVVTAIKPLLWSLTTLISIFRGGRKCLKLFHWSDVRRFRLDDAVHDRVRLYRKHTSSQRCLSVTDAAFIRRFPMCTLMLFGS